MSTTFSRSAREGVAAIQTSLEGNYIMSWGEKEVKSIFNFLGTLPRSTHSRCQKFLQASYIIRLIDNRYIDS